MDYVQALFSFFIAPLFGTVILGMLWKRATRRPASGGCWWARPRPIGLWLWVKNDPSALRYVALSPDAKEMAENIYRALWAWSACVIVTVMVSLVTKPRPESELVGLVYGATKIPQEHNEYWYQNPIVWAVVIFVVFVALNILFW